MSKTQTQQNGWREVKLGDYVDVVMGQSPPGSSYNENGDGLPFYQGVVDFGERFVTPRVFTTDPKKIVDSGFVLLSVRAPVGRVNFTKDKCSIGRGNAGLKMKNGLQNFLYYLLIFSENKFHGSSSGSVFGSINKSNIENLEILLPPLPEQKAIAEVLSSLDDKIDLLHHQNKTLEDMAQALFRKWFIEEAKEDWEVGKLGDVVENFDSKRKPLSRMERDKMKNGKLYPYYGAAQIMDYVNDYIFDGQYVLIAEDGTVKTNEGYPVLQFTNGKFWVNNHTHVLKAKKPYNNFFLWHFLLKRNIENVVTGAVQPKINQTNLNSIEFPKFLQQKVVEFQNKMDPFFEKIFSNQSQIRTLEKLRDTLLPKLMSGAVRVRF